MEVVLKEIAEEGSSDLLSTLGRINTTQEDVLGVLATLGRALDCNFGHDGALFADRGDGAFFWQPHGIFPLRLSILCGLWFLLFLGLPLGFYFNGLLLRKFSSSLLYIFGLLLMGVSVTGIIFTSPHQIVTVALFGFIYGISLGIFWANRNLLTLITTTSENRIYFSGIESSSATIIGMP